MQKNFRNKLKTFIKNSFFEKFKQLTKKMKWNLFINLVVAK